VPPDTQVVLRVPSGATVTPVTRMTVSGNPGDGVPSPVDAGDSYPVAPGSLIAISPRTPAADDEGGGVPVIAFSGTSDIGVQPGATVDIVPEPTGLFDADAVVPAVPPFRLTTAGGAKITVTGSAGVRLPGQAVITGPRRRPGRAVLAGGRWLLIPQGSTVIVGSMGVMVAANILTMFGIGAELGIAFVLARFSDAAGGWADGIYAALAALGGFLLWYAISATRAMANPQPGSSLSAQAGTSFTL
jgi:hypothetical protein